MARSWDLIDVDFESRRRLLAALAIVGAVVSTYLALYQLHVVGTVAEPFFGGGSAWILRASPLARHLPVPDALLGAIAYVADVALDLTGPSGRHLSRPWLVVAFGAVALPMGVVALGLIALQIVWGHLCSLCLVSAAVSLTIAVVAMAEVAAAVATLRTRRALASAQRVTLTREHRA
ncbi:MAG TPA: vitamin K epoxide reductase family protein [Acidimicrobiales bacterium]|nr:vitamin K epoxide reductase family protein [Acidimicrobiales bacterium]